MFECLETARAYSMLHDPQVAPNLRAEQFLELAKRAGYSEDAAQKAATAHANRRLDQELPP